MRTFNSNIQFKHSMRTFNSNIQFKHSMPTFNANLQCQHSMRTFNANIQVKHSMRTFNANIQSQDHSCFSLMSPRWRSQSVCARQSLKMAADSASLAHVSTILEGAISTIDALQSEDEISALIIRLDTSLESGTLDLQLTVAQRKWEPIQRGGWSIKHSTTWNPPETTME